MRDVPRSRAEPAANAVQDLATGGHLGEVRMVTGFILFAEGLDDEGERTWSMRTALGQPMSVTVGQVEMAGTIVHHELEGFLDIEDEDEEDP